MVTFAWHGGGGEGGRGVAGREHARPASVSEQLDPRLLGRQLPLYLFTAKCND